MLCLCSPTPQSRGSCSFMHRARSRALPRSFRSGDPAPAMHTSCAVWPLRQWTCNVHTQPAQLTAPCFRSLLPCRLCGHHPSQHRHVRGSHGADGRPPPPGSRVHLLPSEHAPLLSPVPSVPAAVFVALRRASYPHSRERPSDSRPSTCTMGVLHTYTHTHIRTRKCTCVCAIIWWGARHSSWRHSASGHSLWGARVRRPPPLRGHAPARPAATGALW